MIGAATTTFATDRVAVANITERKWHKLFVIIKTKQTNSAGACASVECHQSKLQTATVDGRLLHLSGVMPGPDICASGFRAASAVGSEAELSFSHFTP